MHVILSNQICKLALNTMNAFYSNIIFQDNIVDLVSRFSNNIYTTCNSLAMYSNTTFRQYMMYMSNNEFTTCNAQKTTLTLITSCNNYLARYNYLFSNYSNLNSAINNTEPYMVSNYTWSNYIFTNNWSNNFNAYSNSFATTAATFTNNVYSLSNVVSKYCNSAITASNTYVATMTSLSNYSNSVVSSRILPAKIKEDVAYHNLLPTRYNATYIGSVQTGFGISNTATAGGTLTYPSKVNDQYMMFDSSNCKAPLQGLYYISASSQKIDYSAESYMALTSNNGILTSVRTTDDGTIQINTLVQMDSNTVVQVVGCNVYVDETNSFMSYCVVQT